MLDVKLTIDQVVLDVWSCDIGCVCAAVEFLNKVSAAEEQHAQQLMNIVKNFRKKTTDNLKKDP